MEKMLAKKAIWVTWEKQRRNRELSAALGIKLFELSEIDNINNPFKKYIVGIVKTLVIMRREKPEIVICQNPSIILSFFMVAFKYLKKMTVCVDAHNAGIFPKEGHSNLLSALSKYIQKRSDLTIVTNNALKSVVEKNGGLSYVLQDRIPNIPPTNKLHLRGKMNLLFICSYSVDEPYQIVFQAAKKIDPSIFIYVTGDYKKIKRLAKIPKNVVLTGYLPDTQYFQMLNSVDIIIDLTTRENCLVCGAYESVAVGKPLILSNQKALREYFHMGVVYTENTAKKMEQAIIEALNNKDKLKNEITIMKKLRTEEWEIKKRELKNILLYLINNKMDNNRQ